MTDKTQSLVIRLEGDNKNFDQAQKETLDALKGMGATVGTVTDKISNGIDGSVRIMKVFIKELQQGEQAVKALYNATGGKLAAGFVRLSSETTSRSNPLKAQEQLGASLAAGMDRQYKETQESIRREEQRKLALFSQGLKEAESKQANSLARQREQVLNGSNTLVNLKLQEAEKLRQLEIKKYKDLEDIQKKFLSGNLNYIQQGAERNKVLAAYGTGVSRAQAPVNSFIQNQKVEAGLISQAKVEAGQLKTIQTQQLAEMQRQVALEQTIKVHGKLGERTIELKAAQDKQRINENLAIKLKELSDQVKDRTLTNAQAQVASTKAITEAQKQLTKLPPSSAETNRVASGFAHILKTVWDYNLAYKAINLVTGKFKDIVSSMIPAGIALDAVTSSLLSTIGSAAGAESALKAIRMEANRTGIELGSLRTDFKLFQASTSLAGASLKDTWKMFTNMNTVITALHLSADDANGVFLALAQIFNKSKVQSEELVKQLGNLLPGAFASFAAATNRTTEQLTKDMKAGTVYARDTMLQFTQFMANRFAPSFAAASTMLNADINRMNTTFTLMAETMYKTSNTVVQKFVQGVIGVSESIISLMEDTERFTAALNVLGNVIQAVVAGSLVTLGIKFSGYVAGMGAATIAANTMGAALSFAFSPAVIVASVFLMVKSLGDLILKFNEIEKSVDNLINKTAELRKKQNESKPGELNINVEDDPNVLKWKNAIKDSTTLQKDAEKAMAIAAAQNAQPSGFRYEGKIFRSTEARKDLLETITEIKAVLEKNKSQFQIPIEFNDEKFKKDFMASGAMSAKVYLEYEKARKEYLNLQLEATKETAKEEDLRRLQKEDEAEIAARLHATIKVENSEIFKAKADQLDLAVQLSKEEGNQVKTLKLLKEQLDLNKKAEIDLINEKKRAEVESLRVSEEDLKKREELRKKRADDIAKGLVSTIPEESKDSLEVDLKIKEENIKAQENINLLANSRQIKLEAKYRQDLLQLNKEFAGKNGDYISNLEKLAQLSIKNFSDKTKTMLAELSMELQAFNWAVEEQTTGLSIEQIGRKRLEFIEKETQLSIDQLNNAISTTSEVQKQVKLLQGTDGKYKASPELINAIIGQESAGNPNAVSPKGAEGLMQLMPGTARNPGYGITPIQNNTPEENIRVGTSYFNALLNVNKGSVPLALAAYNSGQGRVNQAGGNIPNIPETQNYVKSILGKLSKEDLTLAKEDTQIATNRETIEQKIIDLAKQKQQITHQTVVELREYNKVVKDLEIAQLEFNGKYEEAAKLKFDEQFRRNRKLIEGQVGEATADPNALANLALSEQRAIITEKVSHIYKEINMEAENLKEEELRINQAKELGLINEFQAMDQLTNKRKEYMELAYKNIEVIEKEAALLSKEQQLELSREKNKLNAIKYPDLGYSKKYLQEGNSLGSVNFLSQFNENLKAIPRSETQDLAALSDKNNINYIDNLAKREEKAQEITKLSTLAQAKNYANFFQGTFALGSQLTQGLLDQEIAAHGVRSSAAKKAFALNKAMKIAEATMAIAKGITEALAQGPIIGPIMAGIIGTLGMAQIAQIAAQQMPQAHKGLTNVPEDASYMLKAGERVLAPDQNKDLTTALKNNVIPFAQDRSGKVALGKDGQIISNRQVINSSPNINVSVNQAPGQTAEQTGQTISAEIVRAIAKQEIITATRPDNVIGRMARQNR